MAIQSIAILGGDLRQCYCAEYLLSAGWQAACFHTPDFPYRNNVKNAESLSQAIQGAGVILLPTPLTKDRDCLFQAITQQAPCRLADLWDSLSPGQILAAHSIGPEIETPLLQKQCKPFPLCQSEEYAAANALLTAEGLLSEIIRQTPFSLSSSHVLLLGYGRCGSAIGRILRPLCDSISVLEWELDRKAEAEKNGLRTLTASALPKTLPTLSLLINTIPSHVLDQRLLQMLPSACHIFDIASAPFGFPPDTSERYLLPYFRLPGIPGRFSPAAAGQVIGKTIERISDYGL